MYRKEPEGQLWLLLIRIKSLSLFYATLPTNSTISDFRDMEQIAPEQMFAS